MAERCCCVRNVDWFQRSSCNCSFFFLFILFPLLCGVDVRLHVARSHTSSPDSPFTLISSLTLSNHLLLGLPLFPFPFTFIFFFLPNAPLFSSRDHITSTSFPGPSLRFPPLSYSFISYLVQLRNSAHPVIVARQVRDSSSSGCALPCVIRLPSLNV